MTEALEGLKEQLRERANSLTLEEKSKILQSIPETGMHQELAKLFRHMYPQAIVEITHGPDEQGADLVIVADSPVGRQVFGCIVHKGNIAAGTAGDIAKLVDQTRQTYSHPRRIKATGDLFDVDNVWIVLVGEFTDGGARRFRAEVAPTPSRVRRFELPWLVQTFSEYYPEVFFQADLLNQLQQQVLQLAQIQKKVTRSNKPVSEFNSHPYIVDVDSPIKLDDSMELRRSHHKYSLARLESNLNSKTRMILSGDPGSGKSTAILKIASDMIHRAFQQGTRAIGIGEVEVPLVIRAIDLNGKPDGYDLFEEQIPESNAREKMSPKVVLVDGLDEIPAISRESVLTKANELATRYDCGLIVTSRLIDLYPHSLQGFSRSELLPFEFGQAVKLIERTVADKGLLSVLRQGLEKFVNQIALTHLAITMLIEIAERNREVPASIGELYSQYADWSLGRFDLDKGIDVIFEPPTKHRFLEDFAWQVYKHEDALSISETEYKLFVTEFASMHGIDDAKIRDLAADIERTGLLHITAEEVAFRHRSFNEYFLGSYFVREQSNFDDDINHILANIYFDDIWSEAVFFYVALTKSVHEKLAECIFGHDITNLGSIINLFLMGRVLQAGFLTPIKLKRQIIDDAAKMVIPMREETLRLLGINDKVIPKIMLEMLTTTLGEASFASRSLVQPVKDVLDDWLASGDPSLVKPELALLWAIKGLAEPEYLRTSINGVIGQAAKLPYDDAASTLSILMALETKNHSIETAIKRRLKRLASQQPEEFKRLFPQPAAGKRRMPRRR